MLYSQGAIWEEDRKIWRLRNLFPKTEYERSLLITQRDEEFVFPFGRWFSKIIRENYKFRELTLRRESTMRTENFSGESHGDREEFQLEENKR